MSQAHVLVFIFLFYFIITLSNCRSSFFFHTYFCPHATTLYPLNQIDSAFPWLPCSGPSAVPWWRSCRCPWSANAGSNTSPSHPLWWKRRRSSTCTLSTTADCQGKRPWPEMGISTVLSPSVLQRGGLQRHGGERWGEMVKRMCHRVAMIDNLAAFE